MFVSLIHFRLWSILNRRVELKMTQTVTFFTTTGISQKYCCVAWQIILLKKKKNVLRICRNYIQPETLKLQATFYNYACFSFEN
jgi:hypothetical protein